ncbi:MAG: 50S ribosomal protein L1 [Methanosarcinales archaeon]|uniref:Large ribosomal subunit protein uL1 n=1 Tax=Candidatus Ethanoperedens thermophilum TaxID=2766897 RepID=A0A848D938_9EURY|nr:50S ribosomal protein L1 [Candidatus Ethanoperedens thermophilum]
MTSEQITEAVKKVLEISPQRGFEESVDLAINLRNLDLTKPQNRIDEEIILPHIKGKPVKIAVFAKGDVAERAKAAGADYIFGETEIKALANEPPRARSLANEVNFFIAETAYMPMIGKSLGRVLGPRGKMPEPLTSDKDIAQLINRARNSIKVRSKDRTTFHVSIGQRTMQPEKLVENVESVITRMEQKLERGAQNIRSVYIKTTMGPAVRVV